MNLLPRLISPAYLPTEDDILNAHSATLGVAQSTFEIPLSSAYQVTTEHNATHGGQFVDIHIYDFCGARGQRASWAQFFGIAKAVGRLNMSFLFE